MNLGNFIGDFKVRVKNIFSNFKESEEDVFIDVQEIEKAKAVAVGTLSEKTGLTKQFDGSWKKQSNKKIETFDELYTKYYDGTITSEELRKLKQIDNKAGITSAKLLDDLYLTKEQREAKKAIYDAGFSKFDYFNLKKDMDSLFGKKGSMQIQINHSGKVEMIYENKGVYIEREFGYDEYSKKVSVNHFKFELDEKLQNKGYAKAVLKSFYEEYKKAQIDEITTLANMNVGGYAWAKYGFCCESEDSLRYLIDNEKKNSPIWEKHGNTVDDLVNKFYERYNSLEPFPMRLIANLHDDNGNPIGKELLLGTQWGAVLDLSDNTSRMIFERYLEDNKVKTIDALEKVKKLPETIDSSAIFKNEYDDSDSTYPKFIKTLMNKGITKEEDFFKSKKVEEISVFELHPTKEDLDRDTIIDLMENQWDGEYPLAIKSDNKYYVIKGHDKVATDIILAKQTIKIKVHEIE